MADISTELARILVAVYGNEVRGSIHDAIEKINDVSEVMISAGTEISSQTSTTAGYYSGSLYMNTSTNELWRCLGASWELLGNLKGERGVQGLKGTDGTGIDSVVDNGNGTFKFYLTNGTYSDNVATIKGDTGATGATGATGPKGRDVTNIQMTGTGKVHPISVTYSDGITQNIGTLQDGADGSGSGDMQFATYDPTQSGIVESARALSDGTTTIPMVNVMNKADSADSLAGYGIEDAYTKEEVDKMIEDISFDINVDRIGGSGRFITSVAQTNGELEATEVGMSDIVDGMSITVAGNKLRAAITPSRFQWLQDNIAPSWSQGSYPSGSYVMNNDQLYRNNSANATSGVPGVSSDWVETSIAEMLQTQTGTWTPTAREPIASFSNAMYSRTGNVVTCSARCVFGNITATYKMYFTNLPLQPAVDSQITGAYRSNSSDMGGALLGNIGSSDNRVWANDQCKAFSNDTVYICFTYICK